MKIFIACLLPLSLLSCKTASSSGRIKAAQAEGDEIYTVATSSRRGLVPGESSDRKPTLSGTVEKDGWVQLIAEDGLNFVYKVKVGDTAANVAEQLKIAIDPGPFDLNVSVTDNTAEITVLANLDSLQSKKTAAEAFFHWSEQLGNHEGLTVIADGNRPAPKFNTALAITWVIQDGRPQPPTAYLLEDDTLYVAVNGAAGITWLGGTLVEQ
jgi:hypothetical protein